MESKSPILLIAENSDRAERIGRILKRCDQGIEVGYKVRDAQEALSLIRNEDFELVLYHISRRGKQLEAVQALAAVKKTFSLIVFSTNDSLGKASLELGADDYLGEKEWTSLLLSRVIRYALEKVRAEKALAKEQTLMRTLMANIPDRIYFKDEKSRFLRVNQAMVELFDLKTPDELTGKTDFDFFSIEHAQPAFDDEQEVMRSGKPIIGKVEKEILPDGEVMWALTTKMPLKDKNGKIIGTFGISRDFTEMQRALDALKQAHEELRNVQLQLIEAEKMKSIGRLAAGVAHEVKNPLAIIEMGVDYLRQVKFPENENVEAVLADIRNAAKRADDVVKGLLDFSKPKKMALQKESLNKVIEQALLLVRGELAKADYKVVKKLDPTLPAINIDPSKMGQVFVNLFSNSLHAMKGGGCLTVKTYVEQLTGIGSNIASSAAAELFQVGTRVVKAEVSDTGTGIPEDKIAKIFDPFFTTKPTGIGTGLGLTVAKTIIDLHGGVIEIRNQPDGGVKAVIMFRVME